MLVYSRQDDASLDVLRIHATGLFLKVVLKVMKRTDQQDMSETWFLSRYSQWVALLCSSE
jgi:hypothetical protein